MNKSYNGLSEQLAEAQFKDLSFTIFNYIEDEGYLFKLKRNGYEPYKDDIEYFQFVLSDEDKTSLKNDEFQEGKQFKKYIENEVQSDGVLSIFLMKKYGVMIAVKPKGFDIKRVFNIV